jgi:DNA polymerase III delta prime subunit
MEEFLWVEKHRPRTIEDTILPADLKQTFKQFIKQENIPNLILSGSAGVGKTTVARAMLEEIGADYYVINGSMNGNIDTLRHDIMSYASSLSLTGGRKYVILDEADYLNANSTQPALRNFMEEYSHNCGFILTCNYVNRIIEPLRSRCSVVDFNIGPKDMPKLALQFMNRIRTILTNEGVVYETSVLAEVIKKFFPDFRRTINELQRYSATGAIDTGILTNFNVSLYEKLLEYMKDKNFTEVRKWIAENSNGDMDSLFGYLYDNCAAAFKTSSIPELVLIIGKYQYQGAFVSSHEINLAACMVEIMKECEFK